jgi:meso-butanediol dehydrogenase/(S,S)-butanediol dehydrogenase/diacetyl reductase
MRLSGKGAVVTGAAKGIGRAIAEELFRNGADLLLVDLLPEVRQTAEEIAGQGGGGRVFGHQADVRALGALDAVVREAAERLGTIDILVNNAGVCKRRLLAELTEDEWVWQFEVNVKGLFFLTKAVTGEMIRTQTHGKIVNIASIMAKIGEAGFSVYTATKHAILGFTRCVAYEMARYQIAVNAVCPGIVDTDMELAIDSETAAQEGVSVAEVRKRYESLIPFGRYAYPRDIAKAVLFLSSQEADFITGQAINVCGGMVMH